MLYSKPALTFEDQAALLLRRGLLAAPEVLIARLKAVSYYRLSGYLYPFRNDDDSFRDGTKLDEVWRRYTFDRRLRTLVMDAIERVEVSVRSQLIYNHAHAHGPFGYTIPGNLPNLDGRQFGQFLAKVYNETHRSGEAFAKHFRERYGDQHGWPPVWMAAEVMSFGTTLTFFRGASVQIKKSMADNYGQADEVFESWLLSLNTVRNLCAHHSRLWNKTLGVSPKIPRKNKHPQWHSPVAFASDHIFAILTILKYLLGTVAPQSKWPQRLCELLELYPEIPQGDMGFPENWRQSPLWA